VRGPEEYGGQGVDAVATCIVMEEVARVDASASLIPGVNELGTIGLILRGSESSRNRCCRRSPPARPWPLTPCRSGNQAATPLFGIVHVLGVGFERVGRHPAAVLAAGRHPARRCALQMRIATASCD